MATCHSSKPERTHCIHGHELALVGTYQSRATTSAGKVYTSTACKQCKRDGAKRRNDAIRDRRKGATPSPPPEAAVKTGQVDKILQLMDEKWAASTVWEREDIQKQIDELGRRVTA